MYSAKRVISGTHGQCILDGEEVSEIKGLQAKLNFNKEKVQRCGTMAVDSKVLSYEGTGSMVMFKVSSRMAHLIGEKIRDGHDVRFTIISNLSDPDAYGAERVVIRNVSFDDLTLADWTAGTMGEITAPFTFTEHEYLDKIKVV